MVHRYLTDSKPSDNSWSGKYPENAPKGTYIWSRDKISMEKRGHHLPSDAQLIGYIATDGKHAPKLHLTDELLRYLLTVLARHWQRSSEDIHFSLRVDGRDCNVSQVG